MKELRIAIIGCGMISHKHMTVIENLRAQGYDLKVVAASEVNKDRLMAWEKQYGLDEKDLYQDFREMLYVLGMPEPESVYGLQSSDYWTSPAIDKLVGRTAPVEDLGVGGGVIINGRIVSGHFGAGGEIGHILMNRFEERPCACGKKGHLEQYTSATGIVPLTHLIYETIVVEYRSWSFYD